MTTSVISPAILVQQLIHLTVGPVTHGDALDSVRNSLMRSLAGITYKGFELDTNISKADAALRFCPTIGTGHVALCFAKLFQPIISRTRS